MEQVLRKGKVRYLNGANSTKKIVDGTQCIKRKENPDTS